MPIMNTTGIAAFGVGNGIVSMLGPTGDRLTVRTGAGGVCWLTDTVLVYNADIGGDVWRMFTFDVVTKTEHPVMFNGVHQEGGSKLVAANGNWARFIAAGDLATVFSNGLRFPSTVPWSIDSANTVLLSDHEDSSLTIRDFTTGAVMKTIATGTFMEAFHTDVENVYWRNTKNQLVHNGTVVLTAVPGALFQPFVGPTGQLWVVYEAMDGPSYAHPVDDATSGFAFGPTNNSYNPTGRWLPASQEFVFAFSIGAGEIPSQADHVVYTVDRIKSFSAAAVPPTTTLPALAMFERKILFCPYFSFNDRADYGTTTDYVGNVAATDPGAYQSVPYPLIVGSYGPAEQAVENKILAYYVSTADVTAKSGYQTALGWPEKPIIYYLDNRNWPSVLPTYINRERTWIGVQCYRNVGESVSAFAAVMDNVLATVSGYQLPLVLTIQAYNRNGTMSWDDVHAIQPLWADWVRRYNVIGVMPFADMRPGGFNSDPLTKSYMRQLYTAIPERPNRFDYWLPSNWRSTLLSQLNYSLITLQPAQRDYLLGLVKKDLGS